MRKIITKIAICLTILATGIGTTGCGSDALQQIIDMIIGGKTYVYQGNYSVQFYGPGSTSNTLAPITMTYEYANTRVEFVAGNNTLGVLSTARLTVPGVQLDNGIELSNVTLNYLNLANDGALSVNSNSRATGTLTINGSQLSIYDAELKATVTNEYIRIEQLTIYFGESGDYAANIKFPQGTVITTN